MSIFFRIAGNKAPTRKMGDVAEAEARCESKAESLSEAVWGDLTDPWHLKR